MAGTNRKALLKPFQLIGLSAGFGVFVLLIVLLTTRNFMNGLIAAGVVFILSLVVLAMLVLSYKPNAEATAYLDRFETAPPSKAGDGEGADAPAGDDPDAVLDAPSNTESDAPLGEARGIDDVTADGDEEAPHGGVAGREDDARRGGAGSNDLP